MEFRQAMTQTLAKMMQEDEKICILDADLAKPNGTTPLYEQFPNRCFDVGIAEANMIGIAAGLSAYGYKPIAFTFAPFATRRVCDQIAVSVAYAKQNVKIVGTDPGITAELNGGTHMSFEDVAVLRSIPNMIIYDAVDDIQLSQAIEQIMKLDTPVYIRMPRKSAQPVFDKNYKFHLFKADIIEEGTDVTIIATGIMVAEAKKAVELLKKDGINAELISANVIKPLDEKTILESIKKTKHVVTCENHNLIGGLYSAVAELVCQKYPLNIYGIGIQDRFGQVGKYNDLLKEYQMTPQDIYNIVNLIKLRSDMTIVYEKDYIKNFKDSGYRSYHVIIKYPINSIAGSKEILCEIQIRTLAMNFWATIEHSLKYKYEHYIPETLAVRLRRAADAAFLLDQEMSEIREDIMKAQVMYQAKSVTLKDVLKKIQELYNLGEISSALKYQRRLDKIDSERDIDEIVALKEEIDYILEDFKTHRIEK